MGAIAIAFTACKQDDKYVDLNTGKEVYIVKDDKTGYMIDTVTKEPVLFYVNTSTKDTFYGKTGAKINGKYAEVKVEAETEMAPSGILTDDGTKIKVEGDGDVKIKNDDADYKKKVDADGDVKVKDGDTKIKYDAETGKTEVKTKD